jgi:hypothetical protein
MRKLLLSITTILFAIQLQAQYCTPDLMGLPQHGITDIYFSQEAGAPFTVSSPMDDMYVNYTSDTVEIHPGCLYEVAAVISSTGGYIGGVFIDYDGNETFDIAPSEEQIMNTEQLFSDNWIQVPMTTPAGLTKARFMVNSSAGGSDLESSCVDFSDGNIEDYYVNIVSEPTEFIGVSNQEYEVEQDGNFYVLQFLTNSCWEIESSDP